MQEKGKYPIPDWCKKNCVFRDKKAKYMPACNYVRKLNFTKDSGGNVVCLTYRKEQKE